MAKAKIDAQVPSELDRERREHLKTKIKLAAKEREIHQITQSQSYKLAKKIALSKHFVKRAKNKLADATPQRAYSTLKNRRYISALYSSQDFLAAFEKARSADTAVALHLYYPEMAPYYAKKLASIQHLSYNLFITIPDTKHTQAEMVKSVFPTARISIVPNGGRDVLPFVESARHLRRLGYEKVLKLHSKKSPHRDDGDAWRDRIVDSLLPVDVSVQKSLLEVLEDKQTAIVGPAGEYVSLLVNYSSTSHHIQRLVSMLIGDKTGREMASRADEFGFYAGTMFWLRLNSIDSILDTVKATDFEPEKGQVDSTMAHALERLFCVIPELEGRQLYDISANGVSQIDHHTTNIPEWSELYIEP